MINRIKRQVLSIFKNFRRLINWIPTLWNNEDWDHDFLFIIERYKLKRMMNEFSRNEISENDWRSARDIKVCISLLDEILNPNSDDRYVNLRNWKRIVKDRISKEGFNYYESLYNTRNDPPIPMIINGKEVGEPIDRLKFFKSHLREEKVYKLYFKIRYYRTDNWWN